MIDLAIVLLWTVCFFYLYTSYGFLYIIGWSIITWATLNWMPLLFGYERVSGSDGIWLLDSPTNKMFITSIGILERITADQMKDIVRASHESESRAKKVIKLLFWRFYWKKDKNYNFDNHFETISNKMDKNDFQQLVNSLVTKELDPKHPPHKVIFVENYENDSSAFILRFHHAFADGLSMVSRVVWPSDEGSDKIFFQPPRPTFLKSIFLWTLAVISLPYSVISLALLKMNKNKLHGMPLTGKKTMYWTNDINFSDVGAICKKRKITFNDFLTASVIQALNEYAGCDLGELVSYIPFSLRGQPTDGTCLPLENDFAALLVRLPKGDFETLLNKCSSLFNKLKSSLQPFSIMLAMKLMGKILPPSLSKQIMYFFANKATLLFSNVPGPKKEVRYKGKLMRRVISMSPTIGTSGISITSFSYNGYFLVTCYADVAAMPDVQAFIKIVEKNILEEISTLK
ncbi:unnamed protein product [Blepharisma stoltei]|uniref:Diacylglycerol O-acyltransferase n=1 Tax=Blepharisma stoltei TaxID=1481888 RepID=A0AAU9K7T1_9CILI|nr:unnamed protein product [Blepharisma stoltei]